MLEWFCGSGFIDLVRSFVGVVGEFVGSVGGGGGSDTVGSAIALTSRWGVVDARSDSWYTGFVLG